MSNNNNIKNIREQVKNILSIVADDGYCHEHTVDEVMQIIEYQVFGSVMSLDFFNSWVNYAEERDGK